MKENRIQTVRSARYYTLGAPGSSTKEVWFVCHGFGQLAARFLRRFEGVASLSRVIVAPEALNRFYFDTSPSPHGPDSLVGATWMTREDREAEIHDYVRYLDAVRSEVMRHVDSGQATVLALGFSQGVATVCRWFTLGDSTPDQLVIWSGNIPSDIDLSVHLERWRRTRLSIVWGDRDREANAPAVAKDSTRLTEAGVTAEWLSFPGGHELDPSVLARLAPDR